MGEYVNANKITISGTVDVDNLKQEIADLIGVPPREEGQFAGRIVSSDLCVSSGVDIWSKNKPFLDVAHSFESDTERDNARKEDFFGVRAEETLHPDNALVSLVEWKKKDLTGYPKRLLDFDGYNHSAKSGVLIKNAPSVTSDITLETNPDTGDNITMKDVLELLDYGNASRYDWVVVDPFGFIHEISGGYTNNETLINYLFTNTTKKVVNIYEKHAMVDAYSYLDTEKVPPRFGKKWYIGLAAKGINDVFPYERYILNPLWFKDNRPNLGTNLVSIDGFTPNMIIGTAASGMLKLQDILYKGHGSITCCKDDFLFFGFELKNVSDHILSMSNIQVLMYISQTSFPKSIQLCRYNADLDTDLQLTEQIGRKEPSTGIDPTKIWSQNMCYIRLNGIWSAYGSNDFIGKLAIAYVNKNALIGEPKVRLLTPWIGINLKNNGESTDDFAISATLPEAKPVPNWTDLTV